MRNLATLWRCVATMTVPEGLSHEALRAHNEEFKRLDMKVKFFQRKLEEDLQK